MPNAREISEYFEKTVPSVLCMDGDNVGLLVDSVGEIGSALVALDITDEVIDEAVENQIGLILSHHPLFFELKRISGVDYVGKKVMRLISNNIAAICLHTNLDSVAGGVNDCLIEALGARYLGMLECAGTAPDGRPYGMGRYGELSEPLSMEGFLERTKRALKANGLRYLSCGRPVKRVACCGGSGGEYLELAVDLGCDTYVTSDVKYSVFQKAIEYSVNIIDGDHFCTENVVIPHLAGKLEEGFPELEVRISARHRQIVGFY